MTQQRRQMARLEVVHALADAQGLGKLPERVKRGLKPIIMVVERSFFGGRAVDADGWQEARRSYEDFAFGEGWA